MERKTGLEVRELWQDCEQPMSALARGEFLRGGGAWKGGSRFT